jgi:hypothetical protein
MECKKSIIKNISCKLIILDLTKNITNITIIELHSDKTQKPITNTLNKN